MGELSKILLGFFTILRWHDHYYWLWNFGGVIFLSIDVVVIPVAGMGTRFLPATRVVPKEMLPIVDVPLIQLAVEEAARAGVREVVLVTSLAKPAIEAHFRPMPVLEEMLAARGNQAALDRVRHTLPAGMSLTVVLQDEARGLGHAVGCAREAVGNRSFAVMLPDDFIDALGKGCLADMVALHEQTGACSLAVENVPPDQTNRYGIVSLNGERIIAMVEKPDPTVAPSTLAVVGRYVLPPEIFAVIEQLPPGAGNEIQLTDAIAALLEKIEFRSHRFSGVRYDCGQKLGYLQANMAFALKDHSVAGELREWLQQHMQD